MRGYEDIGPLQLMAIVFEEPVVKGKVADEIERLSNADLIKLVDATLIAKDKDGEVATLEVSGVTKEEAGEYGAYIGALLGIGSGQELIAEEIAAEAASKFQERYEYGLDQDDVNEIVASIPEGGVALTMLIEHKWAIPLRNSLREAGGVLLAQDFLSPELLISMGQAIYQEAQETETEKEPITTN